MSSAKEEILMLLIQHTSIGNIFVIEENVQTIMDLLKDAVIETGVRVRILTSKDMHEQIDELTGRQKIMMMLKETKGQKEKMEEGRDSVDIDKQEKFEIHSIDAIQDQQHPQTKVSILIVDSKVSLVEEPNTDNKKDKNPNNDLALATYSSSESTLLAYISIFETLWAQTELKQKLSR